MELIITLFTTVKCFSVIILGNCYDYQENHDLEQE